MHFIIPYNVLLRMILCNYRVILFTIQIGDKSVSLTLTQLNYLQNINCKVVLKIFRNRLLARYHAFTDILLTAVLKSYFSLAEELLLFCLVPCSFIPIFQFMALFKVRFSATSKIFYKLITRISNALDLIVVNMLSSKRGEPNYKRHICIVTKDIHIEHSSKRRYSKTEINMDL